MTCPRLEAAKMIPYDRQYCLQSDHGVILNNNFEMSSLPLISLSLSVYLTLQPDSECISDILLHTSIQLLLHFQMNLQAKKGINVLDVTGNSISNMCMEIGHTHIHTCTHIKNIDVHHTLILLFIRDERISTGRCRQI